MNYAPCPPKQPSKQKAREKYPAIQFPAQLDNTCKPIFYSGHQLSRFLAIQFPAIQFPVELGPPAVSCVTSLCYPSVVCQFYSVTDPTPICNREVTYRCVQSEFRIIQLPFCHVTPNRNRRYFNVQQNLQKGAKPDHLYLQPMKSSWRFSANAEMVIFEFSEYLLSTVSLSVLIYWVVSFYQRHRLDSVSKE